MIVTVVVYGRKDHVSFTIALCSKGFPSHYRGDRTLNLDYMNAMPFILGTTLSFTFIEFYKL